MIGSVNDAGNYILAIDNLVVVSGCDIHQLAGGKVYKINHHCCGADIDGQTIILLRWIFPAGRKTQDFQAVFGLHQGDGNGPVIFTQIAGELFEQPERKIRMPETQWGTTPFSAAPDR